ncbi:MAG: T9SS type A sorting domain-containing protein [Candidatus Marinimicrobia bacterium]|nr:T9SS type A sorting domain-containing protein [bacterium]MCG2717151.1 T9SS type A sorting domain-containing protein [Candidatus Neomarinimicrobiota bacterium]
MGITGKECVGGLVGWKGDGTLLSNSFATGSVKGDINVGGLVGINTSSNVSNCYATASVSMSETALSGSHFGGLVGRIYSFSVIEKSYATGSVSGAARVGGLVGWFRGYNSIIMNSYATGSVVGYDRVGGLVGESNFESYVVNCYSTGFIPGDGPLICGLVGSSTVLFPVDDSFWDMETSEQSIPSFGTGKTTAEMKTLATFTDVTTVGLTTAWDFETNPNDDTGNNDYWDMDYSAVINNGYPYLSWEDGEDVSLPVELSSFTATSGHGQVTLNWTTESEIENLGFNMYRSLNSNRQYTIINNQLIPGAGNSSSRHEYEYVDKGLTNGIKYWYKLEDVDYSGNTELHGPESATPMKKAAPKEFRLYPNYPNPFNPVTTISYDLPDDGLVELTVYNMRGEKVATLMQGKQEAGSYRLNWDGTDRNGEMVASGIYFLRIASGSYCRTSKMVFIR